MPRETSPASGGWSYLPALDGLRAIAVVAVVLFHFWPDQFGGGFVGVDVFFVLSGFLITSIILDEVARTERLALTAFWGRRVRRLMPAVLVLVGVCAVLALLTGTGSARGLVDSIGALTWTTNWLELAFRGTNWFTADDRTVLDHLWSLAIEEQFYIFWPPVLWWMVRRGWGRRSLLTAIGVLFAGSVAIMAWSGPIIGYFRTDARAFELLAGAALAVSGLRPGRRMSALLVAVGLIALFAYLPVGYPESPGLYPWGFVALTLAFTALVAGSIDPPPGIAAVLTSPPFRHVGRVSYGIYLWHIPVLRFMSESRVGVSGMALQASRIAVLVAVVELSHRFVEEPILRRRVRFGPRQVAVSYGVVGVLLLAYIPGVRSSWEHRYDTAAEAPEQIGGRRRVLATGDLLGRMVGAGLSRDDELAVFEVGDLKCPFVEYGVIFDGDEAIEDDPYCAAWESRWRHAAEDFPPEVAVYSSGFWDTLRREVDGRSVSPGDPELERRYAELAEAQLDVLVDLAPEVVVVIVDDLDGLAARGQRDADDRARDLDRVERGPAGRRLISGPR